MAVMAAIVTAVLFLPGFSDGTTPPETIGGSFVSAGADFESGTLSGTDIAPTPAGGVMALALQPSQQQGGYLSEPREAGIDFNALGLHWKADLPQGTRVDAEVRFSRDGDSWGDWLKVDADEQDLPDHIAETASAGETIGQLVFADQARFFQYRLDLKGNAAGETPGVTRLTASYIDSKGYHETPFSVAGISRGAGALLNPSPADAAPTVISRAAWGADESKMQWDPEYSPARKIIIHHTAGSNSYDPDPAATIRAIYYYHALPVPEGGLGWGDIGYNFLIDREGRIYEGRYGGDNVIAGHALGWNTGTIGIAAMGNNEEADITSATYNAFIELMVWKSNSSLIDPLGSDLMNGTNPPNFLGHSDVLPTLCPGQFLYSYLPYFRAAANARYGKTITAFTVSGQTGVTTIDQSAHTIALTVPYSTDVTALAPVITFSGASVSPASGLAQDFTGSRIYTVTAEDASAQDYAVTVTVAAPRPDKAITAFSIPGQAGATTIDESDHTIALTMFNGTDVTALMPAVTTTGVSVNPASGLARDFSSPYIYTVTAEDSTTQDYTVTVTVAPPAEKYYWTWYDNFSSMNWLLLANPSGNLNSIIYDYTVSSNPMTSCGDSSPSSGIIAPGASAPSRCYNASGEMNAGMGMVGGPVTASSLTGDKAIASQRSLWKGGNSLEEVLGTEDTKQSSHYYWTWYDNKSPGWLNWVMVSNPSTDPIYYRIKIAGADPAPYLIEGAASGVIPAGQNKNARFNFKGGPVEVETWSDSVGGSTPVNAIASQRVLSNAGTASEAFNEVPGIPLGDLSNDYLWTWYDNVSAGAFDWILIANPNADPINYEIRVKGAVPSQMIEGSATGSIAPGTNVTPRIKNVSNGPVEVVTCVGVITDGVCGDGPSANNKAIASQRVLWGPSFEEVPGSPKSTLGGDYHWTWYDQLDAGTYDWIHIINTTGSQIYYQITVGGVAPSPVVEGAASGTIAAGELVHPRFAKRGGPVEVKSCSVAFDGSGNCPDVTPPPIMTSQRVLWHGYFNEVLGTVLVTVT